MPAAARLNDLTNHPGALAGPGAPNVLIGGLPSAVLGDIHVCALPPIPHPPNAIAAGSATVLIGGKPSARMGDLCACGAMIALGCPSVLIGG